jgi:hypothetical protein
MGASIFPRCYVADLCYNTTTNPHYVLEPLSAIREMGCRDPVFTYFLLRGGKEGPLAGLRDPNPGGFQRSTVLRMGVK